MTVIELKRILKDSALILVVLAALLVAVVGSDHDAYLAPAMEMFLLLQASFLGWSLFERERQENAGEYMLSLPLSRTRLLALKVLPRLACAGLLLLAYLALHRQLHLPSFLAPGDFAILFAAFFFLSLALSLSLKNFLSAFFLACLLLVGQVLLIIEADNSRGLPGAILQASLTVAAFPLLFAVLFRGYDIRPASHFNRRFLPGLLVLAVAVAGAIWLFKPAVWNNYYLARDGTLIRNSCTRSEVLPRGTRIPACLVALREAEQGQAVLGLIHKPRRGKACLQERIVSLGLKDGSLKTLYRIPKGWYVAGGYSGEIGTLRDGACLFLFRDPEKGKAMVLALDERGATTVEIPGTGLEKEIGYAGFLSRSPLRLLVIGKDRAAILSGDGRIREIGAAETASVWGDRLLLFDASGMSLFRIDEEPVLLWRREGLFRKVLRHVSGFESRFVLYRSTGKYFLLDMAGAADTELDLPSLPFSYQERGDDLYLVFASGSRFEIRHWSNGRLTRKAWEPGFEPAGIRVSPYGVVAFDRQRYEVQPFAD